MYDGEYSERVTGWVQEYDAGTITRKELRGLLLTVPPGGLSPEEAYKLKWRDLVSFQTACLMADISPELGERDVFGTRWVRATACGCEFETSNARYVENPPELCRSHLPLRQKLNGETETFDAAVNLMDRRRHARFRRSKVWVRFSQVQLGLRSICEECGKRASEDLHHLRPEDYENLEPDLFLALCRDCHIRQHPGWRPANDLPIEASSEFPTG